MRRIYLTVHEESIFIREYERIKRSGNVHNIFVRISRGVLPRFSANQLSHFYRSKLNPDLNHSDLKDEEKQFIDLWISFYRTPYGRIEWKNLRFDLQGAYGLLRSENKVKNYWYLKQKRQQKNYARSRPFLPLPTLQPKFVIKDRKNPELLIKPLNDNYARSPFLPLPTLQPKFVIKEVKLPFNL